MATRWEQFKSDYPEIWGFVTGLAKHGGELEQGVNHLMQLVAIADALEASAKGAMNILLDVPRTPVSDSTPEDTATGENVTHVSEWKSGVDRDGIPFVSGKTAHLHYHFDMRTDEHADNLRDVLNTYAATTAALGIQATEGEGDAPVHSTPAPDADTATGEAYILEYNGHANVIKTKSGRVVTFLRTDQAIEAELFHAVIVTETAALREQLAALQAENKRLAERVRELERDVDNLNDVLQRDSE